MATSQTTNLQLVKYGAGTDNFIRTDYNGNLDKIDQYAGNTNTAIDNFGFNFDTKTVAEFQTAVESNLSLIATGKSFSFKVSISAASGLFVADSYTGIVFRNYASGGTIIAQRTGTTNDMLIGRFGTGTFTWSYVITSDNSPSLINEYIGQNVTKTFSLANRTQYIISVSTIANNDVNATYFGTIATQNSGNSGRITWLTTAPSFTVSLSTSNVLTVTIPTGTWAELAVTKM